VVEQMEVTQEQQLTQQQILALAQVAQEMTVLPVVLVVQAVQV